MVWIIEWTQPNRASNNVEITAFATETDAWKQACHDMMEDVLNDWDLSDPDIEATARTINDYVMNGDYQSAIREYNDYQHDLNDENTMYWKVYEKSPLIGARHPNTIIFQDAEEDEEEDDDNDEEEDVIPSTKRSGDFQATSPGATCRGPCGNYNPDAYADMSDGTYCCYQCKMFSQVFGGKAP